MKILLYALLASVYTANLATAQTAPSARGAQATLQPSPIHPTLSAKPFEIDLLEKPFKMTYSRKGLQLSSPKKAFTARIRWRLQPRLTPYNEDPRRASQFNVHSADEFTLNRARFKVDGTTFGGFADYNFEQDLVGHRLLNLYTDINFKPWFSVRFGQWKSLFSQERSISSGSQQFVERSIVNREFTVDRQAGIALNGDLGKGHLSSFYSFEILNGTGINSGFRGLSSPMLMARYQWNFLGTEPAPDGSDLKFTKKPAAFVAISGLRNTSAFTRFSSSGGGQLDGFSSTTDPGRYHILQSNLETMFKFAGIGVQTETHWKQVDDKSLNRVTVMRGGYYQAGYMLHAALKWMPTGVEAGYRYAQVDPNQNIPRDIRRENTFLVNYYIEGHNDKYTVDFSRLTLQQAGAPGLLEWRYRVQYDVHF